MTWADFVVHYDPKKDTREDISKRILYAIIVKRRLKANKPVVWFIGGDSGEGKSLAAIKIQQVLMEMQDQDIFEFFKAMNVFTPIEYPNKLDALLHDKKLKKANMICMHEARDIVKAKLWHTFLNQSIADINAMSRSVKRLCIMVISQFIRDISSDIRYTITFYTTVRRPANKRARIHINVVWKDDMDIEKPRLRKRRLSGYLIYPNGRYRRYRPSYIELTLPDKRLVKMFEDADKEAKARIIRQKIEKLIDEMKKDLGTQNQRVNDMVDWYSKDMERLQAIGHSGRKGWILKPEIVSMHGLTNEEQKRFSELLNQRLKEKGIIEDQSSKSGNKAPKPISDKNVDKELDSVLAEENKDAEGEHEEGENEEIDSMEIRGA